MSTIPPIPPGPWCPTGGAVLVLQPWAMWRWPFGWQVGWQSLGCLY
jgi:hypothetical protein